MQPYWTGDFLFEEQWGKFINLVGHVFGRLTVTERAANNRFNQVCFGCTCTCGNETVVDSRKLQTGNTKSCGCLKDQYEGTLRGFLSGLAGTRLLCPSCSKPNHPALQAVTVVLAAEGTQRISLTVELSCKHQRTAEVLSNLTVAVKLQPNNAPVEDDDEVEQERIDANLAEEQKERELKAEHRMLEDAAEEFDEIEDAVEELTAAWSAPKELRADYEIGEDE